MPALLSGGITPSFLLALTFFYFNPLLKYVDNLFEFFYY